MGRIATKGDMEEPEFIKQGYEYFDEKNEKWCIKDDAPEWAKKEFAEFYNDVSDENGITKI